MQKITPHLWFDKEAKEAAEFYVSVFPESKINYVNTIHDTPSGDCDTVNFTIWKQDFLSISAGPEFKFNPLVSFVVNFDPLFFNKDSKAARAKLDEIWKKLSDGGKVLMPLDKYPFSEHYGWVADKYGVSWQLILTSDKGEERPPIIPSLMFVGENAGRAEEAMDFYLSVFKNSKAGPRNRYGKDQAPDKEGTIMYGDFNIEDTWIATMDSAREHGYQFNEAISIMVHCRDQQEIDTLFSKLSADPKSEQCGWLKDKFGLSWQITPVLLDEIYENGTQEQVDRVSQAFLKMKKLDIATIEKAYKGKSEKTTAKPEKLAHQ